MKIMKLIRFLAHLERRTFLSYGVANDEIGRENRDVGISRRLKPLPSSKPWILDTLFIRWGHNDRIVHSMETIDLHCSGNSHRRNGLRIIQPHRYHFRLRVVSSSSSNGPPPLYSVSIVIRIALDMRLSGIRNMTHWLVTRASPR